jgi:hypothetical protein
LNFWSQRGSCGVLRDPLFFVPVDIRQLLRGFLDTSFKTLVKKSARFYSIPEAFAKFATAACIAPKTLHRTQLRALHKPPSFLFSQEAFAKLQGGTYSLAVLHEPHILECI